MIKLHARLGTKWNGEPEVLRISTDLDRDADCRSNEALIVHSPDISRHPRFRRYFAFEDGGFSGLLPPDVIQLPSSMNYLTDGDIIRLSPAGEAVVLYRRNSRSNFMLLTEQCNSNCVMCSQPPKQADDHHLVEAYLQAIPLMDQATTELGITGGEPTLLGAALLDLIAACKQHLPETALHMLSNGRMFNYLSFCRELADVGHPRLLIGIPLYSDIAWKHDFVVQARGAFDQTLRGIMNLERCHVPVEIRVVLHRETIGRLPQLARFVARNIPFVEHVALMGLELMGHAPMNLDALWIDPTDYQQELTEAVQILSLNRLRVSIYNHQLCTLPAQLWPYARQSISDWKNEYLKDCDSCAARGECGGFFSSSRRRFSRSIRPLTQDQLAVFQPV